MSTNQRDVIQNSIEHFNVGQETSKHLASISERSGEKWLIFIDWIPTNYQLTITQNPQLVNNNPIINQLALIGHSWKNLTLLSMSQCQFGVMLPSARDFLRDENPIFKTIKELEDLRMDSEMTTIVKGIVLFDQGTVELFSHSHWLVSHVNNDIAS